MSLFLALCAAHFVCDFPLQGDFLAKAKNHRDPIEGVPWQWGLFAHASIHAGAVALLTGSWALASIELVTHALLDWAKSEHRLSFTEDQAAHLSTKAALALLA